MTTTRRPRLRAWALALLAPLVVAAPRPAAAEADRITEARVVRYGDLAEAREARALRRRIAQAARSVCGDAPQKPLSREATRRACIAAARQAFAGLGRPVGLAD